MPRQKRSVSPNPGRRSGEPSKHQRRVKAKLAERTARYEAVPAPIKGGFRKPGSQNLHHQ